MLAAACLGVTAGIAIPALRAQSAPPSPPPTAQPSSDQDNPFPGEPPAANPGQSKPDQANPGQSNPTQPRPVPKDTTPADPASDNPFPGEPANLPANTPGAGGAGGDAYPDRTPRRDADPDGDPVRSPDPLGNYTSGSGQDATDGFASSRSGLKQMPAEDDNDGTPGKSIKNKTREQVLKEDLDVGGYYLDRKDWKGAQSRFAAAFALDAENSDAVWGLAEAERHLGLYKDAADHYKLFLSYDPDGKHSREARKALEELPAARPAPKLGGEGAVAPK